MCYSVGGTKSPYLNFSPGNPGSRTPYVDEDHEIPEVLTNPLGYHDNTPGGGEPTIVAEFPYRDKAPLPGNHVK